MNAKLSKKKKKTIRKSSSREVVRPSTNEHLSKPNQAFAPTAPAIEPATVTLSRSLRLMSRTVQYYKARLELLKDIARSQLIEEIEVYIEESVALNPVLLREAILKSPMHRVTNGNSRLVDALVQLIKKSGLFDEKHYVGQLPKPLQRQADPLRHYATEGWLSGLDPHPLFSVKYYLHRNPDVLKLGVEPLSHYIQFGSTELRDPHPLFISKYYSSLAINVPRGEETLLSHFLSGKEERAAPHPFFSFEEYASRADLTAEAPHSALLHYVTEGWRAGLDPSPLFNSRHYLAHFANTEIAPFEPYSHYVLLGAPHKLSPHPLFDAMNYLKLRQDVSPYDIDPLVHYLMIGEAQCTPPSLFFDPAHYAAKYLNSSSSRGLLWHYITEGCQLNFDPNPDFDNAKYKNRHFSSLARNETALEHFLKYGIDRVEVEPHPTSEADHRTKQKSGGSLNEELDADAIWLFETGIVKGPEIEISEYPGKCRAIQGAPNILVVAHHASEYLFGSERSFLDILEGFKGLPANLFVALPRNVPDYTNAIRLYASKVFVFKYGWWKKNEKPILAVQRAFEKIITENGIHAVHSNTIMLRECLSAAKNRNIPGIVHVRELIRDDRALLDVIGQSADAIIAEVIRQAAWIVGNSKATADAFNKPNRTFVVPNTIDVASLDIANEIRDGVVRFGLISSNITKKGLMDVVELARLAARTGSKSPLPLDWSRNRIGTTHSQDATRRRSSCKFIVFRLREDSERRHWASQCRFKFFPFRGIVGRTVLEAMAARRPVIAYQWGALPELIDHGATGFLVPFKKPVSALQYVEELCANPKLIQLLGSKGRDVAVAKYSTAQYSLALKRAYTSILAQAHTELFGSLARPPLPSRISPGPVVHQARSQNAIAKSSEAPRVAYFCWHFPVPSETFVLNELEVLVNLGLDVIVFCRQSPHKHFTPSFAINYERVDFSADACQEAAGNLPHDSTRSFHVSDCHGHGLACLRDRQDSFYIYCSCPGHFSLRQRSTK